MKLALASLLFVLATGCVVRGQATYGTGYNSGYYQPDLVTISPGVQVVYDYDEPVFYSDNYYWRYSGNTWYRSSQWNNGWIVYNDVPYSIRTNVQNPNYYVRYRPANYQPRYNNRAQGRPQPVRQQPGPVVRDHRQPQPIYNGNQGRPQPQPQGRPQPVNNGPTVRDHRQSQPPPPPNQGGPTVRDHRR